MAVRVVMPQMGESIAEGTIVRWLKRVGESVDRDEPLFEISTDKVDAEVPSPAAGVLVNVAAEEGQTVPVNSVVAIIGDATGVSLEPPSDVRADTPGASDPAPQFNGSTTQALVVDSVDLITVERHGPSSPPPVRERQRSSPVVRRIAKEHHVDIGDITGSGIGGRVTKRDILSFIENGGKPAAEDDAATLRSRSGDPSGVPGPGVVPGGPAPAVFRLPSDRVEPMSVMRRKIAEHMVLSKHTSAHVYSVFEVSYGRVDQIRQAKKDEYARLGAKLTFTSFIAKAAVDCLRRHPTINASIDGDRVIYRGTVNLGIAVALDHGLIVPVVKGAEEKNLLGLSRSIQDVADRARAKKLNPEEVQAGTFTLTNPGTFGAQFGLPVINQPQVAVLGVGTIEKRVVVIDDLIGIRLMGYLTLGYDHRLVDGAVADQFMADLKKAIESFDSDDSQNRP